MKNIYKIGFLYTLTSILLTYTILGSGNILPTSDDWMLHGDAAQSFIIWKYFFNDVWRFPIGLNPNYGLGQGSSIIYSGTIPLLSIFFKLIKSLLPSNFHHFSIWIFLCFLLQSLFSYLLIKRFTKDDAYALIGSIFFITAPLFINTVSIHIALSGQWIILLSFYIQSMVNNKKTIYWIFIILLSSLIQLYFTAMLYLMYSIFKFDELLKNKNFFNFIKELLVPIFFLLPLMYILGYFSFPLQNVLGHGFGYYKLNLLSLFNPWSTNIDGSVKWSWILPKIKINHNLNESFNYIGLGGLLLFFSSIIILLKNIKKIDYAQFRAIILIFVFFFIIALSNKVEYGDKLLFEIPLNKYLYGIASIFRVSGRFFWPCYYLILILGIIIIYKSFNKKKSIFFLSILVVIQIIDISSGLKEYVNGKSFNKEKIVLDDPIWKKMENDYEVVSSTLIRNQSNDFYKLLAFLKKASIKSEVAYLGRFDRKKLINLRYFNYNSFYLKNLPENKFYIINNPGHFNHLKVLFKNENVGFVFRNKIWLLLPNQKSSMNENDKNEFDKIKISKIAKNKKIIFKDLSFINKMAIFGLGWSYDYAEQSLWSDGKRSTIVFKTEQNIDKFKLIFDTEAYIRPKNKTQEIEIFVNGIFHKKLIFNEEYRRNKSLNIDIKDLNQDFILVEFHTIEPKSPFDLLESVDTRKKGIKIHSLILVTE